MLHRISVCGVYTIGALLCQASSGVRCVLALVGHDAERLAAVEAELARYGAMRYTTIVSAPAGAHTLAQPSGLCCWPQTLPSR